MTLFTVHRKIWFLSYYKFWYILWKTWFYFRKYSYLLLWMSFTFSTPTPRERHISKKAWHKTFIYSSINRGTQRYNGRKSRLRKLLSLIQKQLQKYNIRDYLKGQKWQQCAPIKPFKCGGWLVAVSLHQVKSR